MELDFSKLITLERRQFRERVGILAWNELYEMHFNRLGFGFSHFTDLELAPIEQFCKKNPAYHIVTCLTGSIYINRSLPGRGVCYMVGDGDPNPNLAILDHMTLDEWQSDLFFKLWSYEPPPELGELQGGFDVKELHKIIDPGFRKKFRPK